MAVTSALVDSTLRTGSTGTASTVTGVQFGSAFADRVLVPAYLVGSVSQDPTSGTVDGQSAVVTGTNSSGQPGWGFLSAVVASGTSGNVVGNFSSSDTLAVAGVVALTGARSATPSDTFAVLSTSSTIDVAAGGCVVAVAFAASSGSWTGATQLGSVAVPALGGTYYIATFDNGGGALSGRTISYTTADLLYAAAFVAGGGGSPYTLAADTGTFAITGVAAGLKRGLKVGANAASFAITGQDAGLKKGFKVGANVGTFTLGGQAANFVRTYVSPSSAGAFAITGQTVGLRTALGFTALHGAFSLSGQSAGLKVGKVVTANAGSYAITGQDADLVYSPASVSYTLTADTGSFLIAGQDTDLNKGYSLVSSAGSFSISGQAATLRIGKKVSANAGTVLITGQDANLVRTTDVNFEPGAFNITGQNALLRVGRRTSVATGSYHVTGQDVAFSIGGTGAYSLLAETGQFNLNGKSADLLYGIKAGGIVLIRQHYTKVRSSPPKLPERTFDKIHPVEEIRKAAARLSSAGGHARAAALSQKQRTQIASIAAKARWK